MILRFLILLIFIGLFNCLKDKSKVCKCNNIHKSRLIGAKSTNHVPWQVNIQYSFQKYNEPFNKNGADQCSGIILNEFWILTAAKCLEEIRKQLPDYHITINYGSSNKSEQKTVDADLTYIHENYNYKLNSNDYDIGLIKLETPLNINSNTLPACFIDDNNEMINYGNVSLTSYGITKSNFNVNDINKINGSEILRKANFIDESKSGKYKKCNNSRKFICLTGLKSRKKSDFSQICYGDFGAPLEKTYKNKRFVIGVASYERSDEIISDSKCEAKGNGGLVTRLSSHLYWIKLKTKDLCLFDKYNLKLLK